MKSPFEIIPFSIGGLSLQEPMAVVTNWMIASFCVYAFWQIGPSKNYPIKKFRLFFLFLALSTFFGGLGHAFFQYTGLPGKFPSWIFVTLASYQIGRGILFYWKEQASYQFLNYFLWIKSAILLLSSLTTQKFIFIAVDSIFTYIVYAGFLCWKISSKSRSEMRYFTWGVFVLFPSVFIFLLNINFHRWLNRDDVSHLLILGCISFFFLGVRELQNKSLVVSPASSESIG
ncbi:MAG: hypothetical protein EP338_02585 [Bacteroidetes bacterium]|nr:MAG: hypothetical protein EP338_02585 [Bacteroidota bacterium]